MSTPGESAAFRPRKTESFRLGAGLPELLVDSPELSVGLPEMSSSLTESSVNFLDLSVNLSDLPRDSPF